MESWKDFVVVDTEGKSVIREIAIIDTTGELIYKAFSKENIENERKLINIKPLAEIINDFCERTQSKKIIFHNAEHDISILRNSFRRVGINWPRFRFACTCELSRLYYQDLPSYSLEYLSFHSPNKKSQ